MIDVLNLALPYFGLIFIGFACGKLKQIPDTAVAWMNFFIVYVGVGSAGVRFQPPVALERLLQFLQNAAAPCALLTVKTHTLPPLLFR